jgi:hypothetical protein
VLRRSREKGTTLTTDVFAGKAARYTKYRWDYAPEAIQTIFDVTEISEQSVVAESAHRATLDAEPRLGWLRRALSRFPLGRETALGTAVLGRYVVMGTFWREQWTVIVHEEVRRGRTDLQALDGQVQRALVPAIRGRAKRLHRQAH